MSGLVSSSESLMTNRSALFFAAIVSVALPPDTTKRLAPGLLAPVTGIT